MFAIRHPARLPGPLLDELTRQVLGRDHSPAALQDQGIDGDGPMGWALVDWVSQTSVGFAAIGDADQLKGMLRARYPRLQMEVADAGVILDDPSAGLGFVVTEESLFIVRSAVASKREWFESWLASATRTSALGEDPTFRRIIDGLPPGTVTGANTAEANTASLYIAADRIAVELARDAQEVADADADTDGDAAADGKRPEVQAGAARRILLAERLIGSWGPVAAVATLDEGVVEVRAHAGLTEDGLLARLVEPLPALGGLSGTGGAPEDLPGSWQVQLRMASDPRAVLDLLRALHLATASDLERDLLPFLSGSIDLAIDLAPGHEPRRVSLALGVHDRGRALGWAARVLELDLGATRLTPRTSGDHLVFEAPPGIPGATRSLTRSPDPPALAIGGPFWLHFLASGSSAASPHGRRSLGADLNPDVPFSDDYRAAKERFAAANQRLVPVAEQIAEARRERTRILSELLGTLVVRFGRPDRVDRQRAGVALVARGHWRLPAGTLAAMVENAQRQERGSIARLEALEASAQEILAELDELEKQLLQLRARDVQRWDLRDATTP